MKIKATQCIAFADFVLNVGDEYDAPDAAEALRFIEAGFAVPVSEPKVERAVKTSAAKETRKES